MGRAWRSKTKTNAEGTGQNLRSSGALGVPEIPSFVMDFTHLDPQHLRWFTSSAALRP
jgi:hypothetical protein